MGFSENGHHFCHVAIDYAELLSRRGWRDAPKVRREQERLTRGNSRTCTRATCSRPCWTATTGWETFARRYADLAGELAAGEADEARRAELLEIQRVCRKVPLHPAESFRGGPPVLLVCLRQPDGGGLGGRACPWAGADQYLYPYYRADLDRGVLTPEEAGELISLVFIKMNGVLNPQAEIVSPP